MLELHQQADLIAMGDGLQGEGVPLNVTGAG